MKLLLILFLAVSANAEEWDGKEPLHEFVNRQEAKTEKENEAERKVMFPNTIYKGEFVKFCVLEGRTKKLDCLYKTSKQCLVALPVWKKRYPQLSYNCVEREDTRAKLKVVSQ